MQPTKKIALVTLSIGALLLAGRFFLAKSEAPLNTSELRPSDLDFSKSNQLVSHDVSTVVSTDTKAAEPAAPIKNLNQLSEAELKTWQSFESVLNSKNDNDPRINTELKSLSPALHQALYSKYENLKEESRNERGMIVFLIARDLKSAADAEFLKKVYEESPCMSLDDCKKNVGSDDPHFSGLNQTTLMYPQLAGLYQIDGQLSARPQLLNDPEMREKIVGVLRQADNFPVPAVQKKSEEIRRKYNL